MMTQAPYLGSYLSPKEKEAAWNEGKAAAQDAVSNRKERVESALSMVVTPAGEVPPDLLRKRVVTMLGDGPEVSTRMSAAAQMVSRREESKRSRVFKELRNIRLEESNFITYKLMNNGALRQVLDHMFRIACSHGSDLEDGRMSRSHFKIFMEQFGVTTASPYDQFEPRSTLVIREKTPSGEERAEEVQLLRFGAENVDMLFEFGLDRVGNIVVNVLGSSPDFNESDYTSPQQAALAPRQLDDRLTFHEFLICNLECVHRMIPPDYYPPLSKADVHMLILETFYFHLFGKAYIAKQIPSSFDDFEMVDSMAEVVGNAYNVMADVFLYCIAPTKFSEWTDMERSDRYVRIGVGDAVIEYESLVEVIKTLKMPLNLLSSEPTYELFCRYDSGMKKDRVVIDFQGFTLIMAHIAFTLYLTNAAYPTPQSKFQRLMEQYVLPVFQSRATIPPPQSATKMCALEGIKPERATVGTELWIFGQDFPIRATQNGHRCPLYVRFNEVIAKGSCMSSSVGNVVVPRLPTTEDTVTQVSLADGEEPGTFVVKLEAKTLAVVYISNDRLRWTQSQNTRLSFEDVLATYQVSTDLVETLKSLFQAFAEKGPDFELNGEILPGPLYLDVVRWSKICQQIPMCVYDDGDPAYFVSRHAKFFESARPRSDAIDITVPVITFPEMVNVIFKLFIAQHGPDERLVDTVKEALKNAPVVIQQFMIEMRPKRRKSVLGTASLVEHQKVLAQVMSNFVKEGNCVNCAQDPFVRVGENPFLDLEMIKKPVVIQKKEAPDVVFSKAISRFTDLLPKDEHSEGLTEFEFTTMSLETAENLAERGKLYFLNNLVQRMLNDHDNDFRAVEDRFFRAVDKAKTHGRYLAMQLMLTQQALESINDGVSRIATIVVEHENLVIEERKARLNGLVAQSDTFHAMVTQLYQGLKATVNTVRDMTRPFVNDDDPDYFDPKYMFEQASSFKQHVIQQSMQLESAIKLRLKEIKLGPEISAEGLVSKKYLDDDDADEDPEQAALRRQQSQAGADLIKRHSSLARRDNGVSEEELQKRLNAHQEIIDASWEVKLKESEKKRDTTIRECSQLLEGLMRYSQELVDVPSSLANPCFKFLQDRGSLLKRIVREGDSSGSPFVSSVSRPFVMTEEMAVQSDEDQFPSILSMQQELLGKSVANAVKLGMPAVLLRKALTCAKDVLGKYASNATIFSDLSKIMKLELANVMNARTRELLPLPMTEAEMYTTESTTNTLLTYVDYQQAQSIVKSQMQLEDLAALVNVAKEEANAAAAKLARRPVLKRSDSKVKPSLDIPISPRSAALAAYPEQMMALVSPDSILSLEQRVERKLLEKNANLVRALRAPWEGRCKDAQTDPPPKKADASEQAELIVESSADQDMQEVRGGDSDDEDRKGKKKKKKDKKEKPLPSPRGGKAQKSTPPTKSNTSTPPLSPPPLSPQQKVKHVVKPQRVDDEPKEDEAVVVHDDAIHETLADAADYAMEPTIASQLTSTEPARVREKKRSKAEDESDTPSKTRVHGNIDLPGPSMQTAPKTVPLSQRDATETLMKDKWAAVISDQEEDVFEEVEEELTDVPDEETSTTPNKKVTMVKKKVMKKPPQKSNAKQETSSDDDSDDSSSSGESYDKPIAIGYIEEDHIPDISLHSEETKAARELQTKQIEASAARLSACIEEAMKNNPDAAAVHIELQGMSELVRQLRTKVVDLEGAMDGKNDLIKSLKETIGDLKRHALQGLEGKNVVIRDTRSNSIPSVSQNQVDAARMILSEKSIIRARIAKLLRKYPEVNTGTVLKRFDESSGSAASSGLIELVDMVEAILSEKKPERAFGDVQIPSSSAEALTSKVPPRPQQDAPTSSTTTTSKNKSISEDCTTMLRVHFPMMIENGGATMSLLQEDPDSAMPILARSLVECWQKGSISALAQAVDDVAGNQSHSTDAAKAFFTQFMGANQPISDNDIRGSVDTIKQLKQSSADSKRRVSFMISQHAKSVEEANAAEAALKSHIEMHHHTTTPSSFTSASSTPHVRSTAIVGLLSDHSDVGHLGPLQSILATGSTQSAKPSPSEVPFTLVPTRHHHPQHDQHRSHPIESPHLSSTKGTQVLFSSLFPGAHLLPDGGRESETSQPRGPSRHSPVGNCACVQTDPTPLVEAFVQTDDNTDGRSPGSENNSLFLDEAAGDIIPQTGDEDAESEFDYAAYLPVPSALKSADSADAEDEQQPQPVSAGDSELCEQISFVDMSVQTDPLPQPKPSVPPIRPSRAVGTQSDGASCPLAFVPSQPWKEQLGSLFSGIQSSVNEWRIHDHPIHQWLLGVYHCLRSNMLPNLDLVADQYASLLNFVQTARTEMADIPLALYEMMVKGVESLNEACGGPLTTHIQRLREAVSLRELPAKVDCTEVNILLTNLMSYVDHRLGSPSSASSSQRSINRWRTHVILTLLSTLDKELQPCFPEHQRQVMLQLVEYEELSNLQQRRLFFLQATAVSLLIFGHCSRRNYVSLAHAAKVDTPLPLSLQASSTSYLRMVRDCLLSKIIPERFNDIGLRSCVELSLMTKQFVSRVLSFSREEYSWLTRIPPEVRTKSEIARMADMNDIVLKSKQWNPVPDELSLVDWLDITRSTLLLLLGPEGRIVPSELTDLGAPRAKKNTAADTPSTLAQQMSIVVDQPAATQPSSLDECPTFLRDVQWAKLSHQKFSNEDHHGNRQHMKCETPPPFSTAAPTSPIPKVAFTPGKISVARSASFGGSSPIPAAVVVAHGGSALGGNTTHNFSASSTASVITNIMQATSITTIKPLTVKEQRELKDLRELCSTNSGSSVPPMRCYRAWLDLEVRDRVAELRAFDVDSTPPLEAVQECVTKALKAIDCSAPAGGVLTQSVNQLSSAQTKLFVQVLRGGSLRGSRIPSIIS